MTSCHSLLHWWSKQTLNNLQKYLCSHHRRWLSKIIRTNCGTPLLVWRNNRGYNLVSYVQSWWGKQQRSPTKNIKRVFYCNLVQFSIINSVKCWLCFLLISSTQKALGLVDFQWYQRSPFSSSPLTPSSLFPNGWRLGRYLIVAESQMLILCWAPDDHMWQKFM